MRVSASGGLGTASGGAGSGSRTALMTPRVREQAVQAVVAGASYSFAVSLDVMWPQVSSSRQCTRRTGGADKSRRTMRTWEGLSGGGGQHRWQCCVVHPSTAQKPSLQ